MIPEVAGQGAPGMGAFVAAGALFGVPGLGLVIYVWLQVANLLRGLAAARAKATEDDRKFLLDVCDSMKAELGRTSALLSQYSVELALLRQAREGLASALSSATEAALAARLMVHELQDRAGAPRTEFSPLPQASAAIPAGLPAPPKEA